MKRRGTSPREVGEGAPSLSGILWLLGKQRAGFGGPGGALLHGEGDGCGKAGSLCKKSIPAAAARREQRAQQERQANLLTWLLLSLLTPQTGPASQPGPGTTGSCSAEPFDMDPFGVLVRVIKMDPFGVQFN